MEHIYWDIYLFHDVFFYFYFVTFHHPYHTTSFKFFFLTSLMKLMLMLQLEWFWFWSLPADGSEGGRAGLRPVPDPGALGGPGEEIQTEAEEGAGAGGEERPGQVRICTTLQLVT